MANVVVKMAQVEYVEPMGKSSRSNDCCAMRIKARLSQDGDVRIDDIPYAFPLLPKMLQTAPQVGEMVLIITAELKNNESNRYYIGPVISQPQRMKKDEYHYGRGTATSTLVNSNKTEPLETIANYNDTVGSFPKESDVALIGRVSEDIILKDKEIDIRCGVRLENKDKQEGGLKGNVIFNDKNPSYIRLKMHKNGKSSVAVVADETIILSHEDAKKLNGNITFSDREELLQEEQYTAIVNQLHQVPYGDVLVEYLELIRKSILSHVHPWPGVRACVCDETLEMSKCDFPKMLSQSLKIS